MSKVFALTHVLFSPFTIWQARPAQNFKIQKISYRKILVYVLIGCNSFLFFSYIFGVNSNTSQGYEIKKLQTQIVSYTEQNKKLNLQISEISSMVSIQSNLAEGGFVSAGTPKFLEIKQYTLK